MMRPTLTEVRKEYLDLMQAWLTGSLWRDGTCAPFASLDYDAARREHGLDWPSEALTMIGVKRLSNLRQLTQTIIEEGVPGDLIETGIWRGGACIMMRAVLFTFGVTNKRIWAADSFSGLPPGDPEKYPLDAKSDFHSYKQLAVPLNDVKQNFKGLGLLDNQTVFLQGWFKDTLPKAAIDQLALIRLDGDMYESTMDALDALYPKLTKGGFVIIDDYHIVPACRAAVTDYCTKHGLEPDISEIDGVGVFWRNEHTDTGNSRAEDEIAEDTAHELTERISLATESLRKIAVDRLVHALAVRDQHLQALNVTNVQFKSEIATRDAELARILDSRSWRYTRPFRDLMHLARRLMPIKR